MNPPAMEILLVEDNPVDIRFIQQAFEDGNTPHTLRVLRDGEEALAYLYRQGVFKDAVRPSLILLDLNLPRVDGRQILEKIKSDPALLRIPVIVLTTSLAEEDILKSYDLRVNCYITKPVDMQKFIDVLKAVRDFWLTIVSLPPAK